MPGSKRRSLAARQGWRKRKKDPVGEIHKKIHSFLETAFDDGDYYAVSHLRKMLMSSINDINDWIDEEFKTGAAFDSMDREY